MRRLAYILALVPALALGGGWSTNCWPSATTPFAGRQRARDLEAAIQEREKIVGTHYLGGIDLTVGWFNNRANLIEVKKHLKAMVPKFIDLEWHDVPFITGDGGYYGWDSGIEVKLSSATGVCVAAGAPSNWFDVTPWFDLSGSSNGWRFATGIVWRLYRTHATDSPYIEQEPYHAGHVAWLLSTTGTLNYGQAAIDDDTNGWTHATNTVTASYPSMGNQDYGVPAQYTAGLYDHEGIWPDYFSEWYAAGYYVWNQAYITEIPTNFPWVGVAYVRCKPIEEIPYKISTEEVYEHVFDANGVSHVSTNMVLLGGYDPDHPEQRHALGIDSVGSPPVPLPLGAWCSEPAGGIWDVRSRGWMLNDAAAVIHWEFPHR